MVHVLVERATSDYLIGPDWALNVHISEFCNRDPMEAKHVVRGIRKRLGSRTPKVQLLALALLETLMHYCGDYIHLQVIDKGVLHKMVKIARKKPDYHVREKILILIDTWREAFGGTTSRYPQYFAAYEEMLYLGLVFPRRSDISTPVFAPQVQPHLSLPPNTRSQEIGKKEAESSAEPDFPTLSLTEIQNARGIMDVLADMLSAISPGNKERLKQEVIVDLVEQCRTYKQRVVHLVNSTSDESLLCEGLALNDDLQRLLAKHEELSDGNSDAGAAGAPLIDTGDVNNNMGIVAVPEASGSADPLIDLLSGDINPSKAEDSLAIVQVEESQSNDAAPQQNALALVDMLSEHNASTLQPPQNDQIPQEQQPPLQDNGNTLSFPRPPWEEQPEADNSSLAENGYQEPMQASQVGFTQGTIPPQVYQHMENGQAGNEYIQPTMQGHLLAAINPSMNPPHPIQRSQSLGLHPQQMQYAQMAYMYPQQMYNNQMAGYAYGYSQFPNNQYPDQRMSGLSGSDDGVSNSSTTQLTQSYVPSGKPSKPQDRLFGDLVDIKKFKPTNSTHAKTESM
ncbi:TOM1-like protein 9 isoform X1 [Daucus carota subsp. sativus]|uniref:TOM1-like protein 9 isoform X1 n=1 Tax=Daucus carota subsp. sativus TaxID=79200 RepID=UPI003083065D